MTSAELGCKAPYSSNIRWHVVWQRIGMELPFRDIARNLCLSLGTVHNHSKRFGTTGNVEPLSLSTRDSIRNLNDQQELIIVGLLLENPALYLSGVCWMITSYRNPFLSTYSLLHHSSTWSYQEENQTSSPSKVSRARRKVYG